MIDASFRLIETKTSGYYIYLNLYEATSNDKKCNISLVPYAVLANDGHDILISRYNYIKWTRRDDITN